MPALRSFSAKFLRDLRDSIEPSVVQLGILGVERWFEKGKDQYESEPEQLGTGIILCRTPDYIGVITTVNCNEALDSYGVVARFCKDMYLRAEVVMQEGMLFGLVIRGHDLGAVPCTPASFYEGKLSNSGPAFVVGCHGDNKDQIIVSGMISVEDFKHLEDDEKYGDVWHFVHTCPIGDGLIGAPVLNQYGQVLGMNVSRSRRTSKVNYALKNADLKKMLAMLVKAELKPETQMEDLLKLFSVEISKSKLAKEERPAKRKSTTNDTGARQLKRRQ